MKGKIGVYFELWDFQDGEEQTAKLLIGDIQEYAQRRINKLRKQRTPRQALMSAGEVQAIESDLKHAATEKARVCHVPLYLQETKAAFERTGTVRGAAQVLGINEPAAHNRMKRYAARGLMRMYPW